MIHQFAIGNSVDNDYIISTIMMIVVLLIYITLTFIPVYWDKKQANETPPTTPPIDKIRSFSYKY